MKLINDNSNVAIKNNKECNKVLIILKNWMKDYYFCKNSINSFMKRVKLCKDAEGKHFEYKK